MTRAPSGVLEVSVGSGAGKATVPFSRPSCPELGTDRLCRVPLPGSQLPRAPGPIVFVKRPFPVPSCREPGVDRLCRAPLLGSQGWGARSPGPIAFAGASCRVPESRADRLCKTPLLGSQFPFAAACNPGRGPRSERWRRCPAPGGREGPRCCEHGPARAARAAPGPAASSRRRAPPRARPSPGPAVPRVALPRDGPRASALRLGALGGAAAAAL